MIDQLREVSKTPLPEFGYGVIHCIELPTFDKEIMIAARLRVGIDNHGGFRFLRCANFHLIHTVSFLGLLGFQCSQIYVHLFEELEPSQIDGLIRNMEEPSVFTIRCISTFHHDGCPVLNIIW